MKNYLKLLRFLKGNTKVLGLATLCMFLSAVFDGFQLSLLVPMTDKILSNNKIIVPGKIPAFLASIIEKINATDSMTLLKWMIVGVIIMFILKGFFGFWYGYLMNDASQRIMRDMRSRLYETIQNLSLDYFSKKRSGELIARITNDVQVVENAVSYGVTDLVYQSFRIVIFASFVMFVCFKMSLPKMAIVVLILFPVVALPMKYIGRRLKKISRSSQEKMADINSLLIETISGVRIVKAFCMEKYESNRFKSQNQDFYKLKMKSIKRNLALGPITELIGAFFGVAICYWMGSEVINGRISFGVFVLFFGSTMSLISPLKKLANVHVINQQALAASERIYEVLDSRPSVVEKVNAQDLPVISQNIDIRGVNFGYDTESGQVLKDINLEIKVGDLVAIVGPTGAGKSTLVNLVPRFYDPSVGSVAIDGIDLKEVSFKSLRGQMGLVTQETILFNDTVRANIAYGNLEASMTEIESAAQKAFAHLFIMNMPDGYNTRIGDRGFRLSGGEKQRIAIARAILKNPPILILDEATSQLDSESERFVQEALDELMEGRTVICIAHRLSTIKKATKIVVLEGGKIVGLGKHEDLMASCSLYQRLYETQFKM
ncbi:MAG TPA: ABC transporter ATP-binding protein [Candidatus Omnitrophota bacterium]|nr:ABC transporter ATP-binding protein [Candidatus Omnitrophota bacterium]HPD84951.1 ABC transporter ATP-binding protein [Candidatus Omnitrophota bacterium]HRZ03809.1 ABC transporter ATP-binding protein [Candidatus Omnitrophota bacterium]